MSHVNGTPSDPRNICVPVQTTWISSTSVPLDPRLSDRCEHFLDDFLDATTDSSLIQSLIPLPHPPKLRTPTTHTKYADIPWAEVWIGRGDETLSTYATPAMPCLSSFSVDVRKGVINVRRGGRRECRGVAEVEWLTLFMSFSSWQKNLHQ